MGEPGNLSQCMVDSDSKELKRTRSLRGRALIASIALEASVLSAMLLWPLLNPAVLPSQPILAPVPVFHSVPRTNPEAPAREQEQRAPDRPLPGVTVVLQPPKIPLHIAAGDNSVPPTLDEPLISTLPLGPGGGIGRNPTSEIVPPEPRPSSNRPVQMSGGVMEALLVHRVEPNYPLPARMMRLSGIVQLRAIIGTDGSIQNLQVLSGNAILAQAAVDAVQLWRYRPTRLSGKPVEVETIITVQFQLN